MRLRDVLRKLTGVSTPFGDLSWQVQEPEVIQAQRIVSFLEDRRVLFAPDALETPEHCVDLIFAIRSFLTNELGKLSGDLLLPANLRVMRSACHKFLDSVQGTGGRDIVRHAAEHGHYASWAFYSALGELRGTFGLVLALMSEAFQIEIEQGLSQIVPRLDDA